MLIIGRRKVAAKGLNLVEEALGQTLCVSNIVTGDIRVDDLRVRGAGGRREGDDATVVVVHGNGVQGVDGGWIVEETARKAFGIGDGS